MKLQVTFKDCIELIVDAIAKGKEEGTHVLLRPYTNNSDFIDLCSLKKRYNCTVEKEYAEWCGRTWVVIRVKTQYIDNVKSVD